MPPISSARDRADRDHRADRDVDAARRDHQGHAQRDQHQRRGAVEDVDQAAVQVAVLTRDRQEARRGDRR